MGKIKYMGFKYTKLGDRIYIFKIFKQSIINTDQILAQEKRSKQFWVRFQFEKCDFFYC